MDHTTEQSNQVSRQTRLWLLLFGLLGPAGGLLIGYNVARGLSRSIYKLSVRVNDVAQRLDENVASMSVAVDGNIESLDRQIQHIVSRVEEVAERLQRHQREMLRAEQLAAVGQLAASVAHEIRNPLTSVKMLVEAALRPKHGMPLSADDLQVIHGEVVRLEQTVQGLLDFARLPAPQRSACELYRLVNQAVDLVKARARQQRVAIRFNRLDDSGPLTGDAAVPLNADAGQLTTVLVNLLLNALDAMPQGGRLDIELQESPVTGYRLAISDTGPGIPPEIADRLFAPFTSTKSTGTGLGLSISRRIVEEHGGTLEGHNRPEGGACFTIALPADAAAAPTERNGSSAVATQPVAGSLPL
jgi:signal transduction histidine kinase